MTRGGVPSLKDLYAKGYGERAHWFEVYVREAHPGESYPGHASYEQKAQQARALQRLEDLPWPVLVDDLDGTVHRAYGKLPNAAYVIDATGRIAFKDQWASAPALRAALDALVERGGTGAPVAGGIERMMHMVAAMAHGWPAIARGGDAAVRDVVTKAPPLAAMLFLGHQMEPLLAPLARRTHPVPVGAKLGMLAGVAALAAWVAARRRARG